MIRRWGWGLFAAAFALACAPKFSDDRCRTDKHCDNGRICEEGQCVSRADAASDDRDAEPDGGGDAGHAGGDSGAGGSGGSGGIDGSGGSGGSGGGCVPGEEICDGADNDCDGEIDEGFDVGGACQIGVGACLALGTVSCDAEDPSQSICDAEIIEPSEEICDGADNDCDGETDEDFPGLGTPCEAGAGACHALGLVACDPEDPSQIRCGAAEGVPGEEICDGVDNDCDGETDEGFEGLGGPCEVGVGACARQGRLRCTEEGAGVECSEVPGAPTPEVCVNDLDDDCDGETDEGFEQLGSECFVGIGACTRRGVLICDPADPTRNRCSVMAGPPGDEDATCDGVDDDCDGLIDEDYLGEVVECGAAACAAQGRLICQDGAPVSTCRAGEAAEDDSTCDGIDDDCDGLVDEDFAARPTTCGIGACASEGEVRCVGGREQADCRPSPPAFDDRTCDGVDDDCDGVSDEDYLAQPTECGIGACRAQGETECAGGQVLDGCTPLAAGPNDATCNGRDEDCDGLLDEDYQPENTRCGTGACAAEGATACVEGVVQAVCVPGDPAADDTTCDGVDDDCDGIADEDFEVQALSCGVGLCRSNGQVICVDGAPVQMCEPGQGAANDATCDGIDDDCDGLVDDDFQGAPTVCGQGACAAMGVMICVNGRAQDSCSDQPAAADDATCDGVDDDCDGQIDEDYVAVDIRCGVGACEAAGQRVCAAGRPQDQCQPGMPAAGDATCDGVDDDCDGSADEDFTELATSCGVGACAAAGTLRCVAGAPEDSCRPGNPAAADAICDGVDEDCDGSTDEDFAAAVSHCGIGACAADGMTQCVGGAVQDSCQPGQAAPTDAICDGVDEDCDGVIDEDYIERQTACGDGICAANGMRTCVGGAEQDSCTPGAPMMDDSTCNGRDDDCDGLKDEDYVPAPTSCGVGACVANGALECVSGQPQDSCQPLAGAANDATCDGIDDDCDGSTDEDCNNWCTDLGGYWAATQLPAPDNYGCWFRGGHMQSCTDACAALGLTCDPRPWDSGREDDCALQRNWSTCNFGCTGLAADRESFTSMPGFSIHPVAPQQYCFYRLDGAGSQSCDAAIPFGDGTWPGRFRLCVCEDDCVQVAADDPTCDGIDDDCDGLVDEDYVEQQTACGAGACAAIGALQCIAGQPQDTCTPAQPTPELCDGLDNDCDGLIDEDGTCCGGNEAAPPCNGCPPGTLVPVGWVCVPPGEFWMGSPPGEAGRNPADEARHWVRITRPYLLKATEVTQAEWSGLMGTNPSYFQAGGGGGCNGDPCDTRPVELVSWYEALAYLNALSEAEGLPPCYDLSSCGPAGDLGSGCGGNLGCVGAYNCDLAALGGGPLCAGYRFPTEAEWEHAARAGTQGAVYNEAVAWDIVGNCAAALDPIAWYICNAAGRTHPVGELLPNAWGVFDMLGNLYELTWDGYRADYQMLGLEDPVSPPEAVGRVFRGGGFDYEAWMCRAARRDGAGDPRESRGRALGFRPARSLPLAPPGACPGGVGCPVIAMGAFHTCVMIDGLEKCWGRNDLGQLGLGDAIDRGGAPGEMGNNLPAVDLGRSVAMISAGDYYACALLANTEVKCWGVALDGLCCNPGDPGIRGDSPGEMGAALPAINFGAGRVATSLAAGRVHHCVILDDGSVRCWGYNGNGQLGLGDAGDRAEAQVANLPAIDLGAGRSAVAVAGGGNHTCALLDTGAVKCWGWNGNGQLGVGDLDNRGDNAGEMGDNLPAVDLGAGRTATAIIAGNRHSCALLDNGQVKCWGGNQWGALGLGDVTDRGDEPGELGDALPAIDLGFGRSASAIAMGRNGRHTCALLDDATVKCWGRNHVGQLGLGDQSDRGDDPGEMGDNLPPVDLGAGRTAAAIAVGGYHTCAALDNRRVKCWGGNGNGQLGLGDQSNRGDGPGEMGDALPALDL